MKMKNYEQWQVTRGLAMLLTGKTRTEVTLFWGRKSRDDFLMVSVLCMSVIAVFFLQPMKLTPFLYV